MASGLEARRAACRRLLKRQGLEAAYFTLPANVRYLSGYAGEDAALLLVGGRRWLLTDSRYQEEARKSAPDCELALWRESMAATAARLLAGVKKKGGPIRQLGVEANILPLCDAARLRRDKIAPTPLGPEFATLRQVKDAAETAAARRAIRVAEAAFLELKPRLRVGMREVEIKAELEYLALRHGAAGMSFPTIVAVGANSSLPHAKAGRRALRPGVPLLIDFGVFVDGYASDLTRTLFLGHAPKVWRERYQAVLAAQAAGVAAIHAGATGAAVDAAAREVLSRHGLAECFIHSLGHGFGLEIHEAPRLSRFGGPLPLHSLVTVEPGVYFPGQGGIRIEDDVRVLADRGEVMSTLARDLEANVI